MLGITLRNAIYIVALVLLFPWLVWRSLRTGRYRSGLAAKLLGCNSLPPRRAGQRIWLHGVSVGEIQLLQPLMAQLRDALPDAEFVVSTTTDTGMDLAQKLYSQLPSTHLIHFPFDFSWAVRRTLKNVDADLLVLGELEVWPNLMQIAHQIQLPVAVVNGRLSPKSFRGYQRLSWLTRPMFNKLSLVVAQTAEYAERFVECGVANDRVCVGGSFKFDSVSFDRNCPQVQTLANLVGIEPKHTVWVVGSSQDPEELTACKAFVRAKQKYPDLKLIVVPRHRERFDEVFEMLKSQPVKVLRRSQLQQPVECDKWDVLLVDTIGELKWWWGLAQLALVGGSFGARNGQNMLEPAGYGSNVAFGPKTVNFRAIVELLLAAQAAQCIPSLDQIEPWLLEQLADPSIGIAQGLRAQSLVKEHQGAIARTVKQLLLFLPHHQCSKIAA
jgi:3-deoxy-D-manno-octulosonic-acid transferase